MRFPIFELRLPEWVEKFLPDSKKVYPTEAERMRLVIELSRLNVENGTGGPFGAAVFDIESDRLVAPGINLVETVNCSVVHAEIVAIMIAQKITGYYDLGGGGISCCELVASAEPCAMCFGAIPWSGISRLVCGAREDDVRHIGFDEGVKISSWPGVLESRGIEVVRDVCRKEAVSVLDLYRQKGGTVYNSLLSNRR